MFKYRRLEYQILDYVERGRERYMKLISYIYKRLRDLEEEFQISVV